MNRVELEAYICDVYGVKLERPFADDQSIVVFRHEGNRKWFAAVMSIKASRLGIESDRMIEIVNLKCNVELTAELCEEDGIYPGYHMSKRYWISVVLDAATDDELLYSLIEESYDLTRTKI